MILKTRTALIAQLSLVIYLMAGFISLTHGAVYGDEPHEHHGELCIIEHYSDDTGKTLAITPPAAETPMQLGTALGLAVATLQVEATDNPYLGRAPPFSTLT
jgi:hypothetical protein